MRRVAAIALITGLWPIAIALIPFAFVLDRVSPYALTRTLAFFVLYLTAELAGVIAAAALWLYPSRARYLDRNYALQRWWTDLLFRGALRIFSMRLEVTGADDARTGPYLLLVRHASTADTVLPASLLANRFGLRFRYVLKRELLWDPCLDIVGNRLPNAFVDRSGAMREREVAAIRALAADLGARDAVLIYPEGTRFSPARLQRARERGIDGADRLTHTLPPRKAGPLALLAAAPGTDVVVLAHTGLEGARSFRELIRGGLVGATIRVSIWRVAAAAIPAGDDERLRWLVDQWLRVDTWVKNPQPKPSI